MLRISDFLCDNKSLSLFGLDLSIVSHTKAGLLDIEIHCAMKAKHEIASRPTFTVQRDTRARTVFPSLFLALFGSVCVFILR